MKTIYDAQPHTFKPKRPIKIHSCTAEPKASQLVGGIAVQTEQGKK